VFAWRAVSRGRRRQRRANALAKRRRVSHNRDGFKSAAQRDAERRAFFESVCRVARHDALLF